MSDYVGILEGYVKEHEKERDNEIKNDDNGQALYCEGIIAGLMIAINEYERDD